MPAPQAAITATWLSFTGWHHLDGRGHKTDYHNLPKEVKPQSEYGDGKKIPTSSTEITEKQPEKRVLWPLHLNLMALCGEARAGHTHTHTFLAWVFIHTRDLFPPRSQHSYRGARRGTGQPGNAAAAKAGCSTAAPAPGALRGCALL